MTTQSLVKEFADSLKESLFLESQEDEDLEMRYHLAAQPQNEGVYSYYNAKKNVHDTKAILNKFSSTCERVLAEDNFISTRAYERQMIEDEFAIWSLMSELYVGDIIYNRRKEQSDRTLTYYESRYSDMDLLSLITECDPYLISIHHIIKWLESIKRISEVNPRKQFLNPTLQGLSHDMRLSLDPDSLPYLADLWSEEDLKHERDILRSTFGYIRCGNVKKAQILLEEKGHIWRSATIAGALPHHDFDITEDLGVGSDNLVGQSQIRLSEIKTKEIEDYVINRPKTARQYHIIGNVNWTLWQKTCWMNSVKGVDPDLPERESFAYDRAIYGSFSGNLDALLEVAHDWYDRCWGCFKTLFIFEIEKKYNSVCDTFSDKYHVEEPDYEDLTFDEEVTAYSKPVVMPSRWPGNPAKIFDSIRQIDYENHYLLIIEALIKTQLDKNELDNTTDYDDLVLYLETFLRNFTCYNQRDEIFENHFLRLSAHLAIVLLNLRRITHKAIQASDYVISRYVQTLNVLQQKELVAFYTSYIHSDEIKIDLFADFLSVIHGRQREQYLEEIKQYFEELYKPILNSVVSKINSLPFSENETTGEHDDLLFDGGEFSQRDLERMNGITWFCIGENPQWDAAMEKSLALARQFVLEKKIREARHLLTEVIAPEVFQIFHSRGDEGDDEPTQEMLLKRKIFVHEFERWDVFFRAFNNYHDWLKQTQGHGSLSLSSGDVRGSSLSTSQGNNKKTSLGSSSVAFKSLAVESIKDCLRGPQNERIVGDSQDTTGFARKYMKERSSEIDAINNFWIPQFIFWLNDVYVTSKEYESSVNLATYIVESPWRFNQHFNQADLRKFSRLMYESYIMSFQVMALNEADQGRVVFT
mmetsp:Transcript_35619/g.40454  ORF Transcript_35619/g.40454 Transcript_35619/m.40454 type:complete len:870 (-) Transcript_35619:37-2646(-)